MSASAHSELILELRSRLASLYGDRLRETILFGSYARGEAEADSDVDVLVVLDGPIDRYAEYRRLGAVTVDLMEQFGRYVAPVVMSTKQFYAGDWPLLHTVRGEGVPL